jgi:hypothetical protein
LRSRPVWKVKQIFEGRDVKIEYRWAENHVERLPALASELVRQNVAVIVSTGGDVTKRRRGNRGVTSPRRFPPLWLVVERPGRITASSERALIWMKTTSLATGFHLLIQ